MGNCKPIAGFPSRTIACVALEAEGLTTRQIGAKLGIEPSIVAALTASARRKAGQPTRVERELLCNGRTYLLSNDLIDALVPHAVRRGTTVDLLAPAILATVLDDDLVNAVLDDAADLPSISPQVSA